jgi:homogentisate 1,2-dioxygenase
MSHLPPAFPHSSGIFSKQAHVDVPDGLYEDEHGRNGFFGRTTHLYHKNPPTAWTKIEGNCIPHAYDLNKAIENAKQKPEPFLTNSDCTLYIYTLETTMPYYFRNGDADECWFIHQGSGLCETDFGEIPYKKGDYIIIPRGTTYRFYPQNNKNFYLLIESYSEFELPNRGMLGRHAFYDPGVCFIPKAKPSSAPPTKNNEWEVVIKRNGELTSVFYPFNPIDVVGWKGDLFAWSLNVADIRPIISPRYHLPPSVHTTLVAKNFVVCTFAPRPTETGDSKAQRVPFFHRNIDYDEVIFYHEGDFFSRSGIIGEGMVTFHPIGIHHGPHPNAYKNQFLKEFAQEVAVMIDTRNTLKPVGLAQTTEIQDYKNSWKGYLNK